MNFRTKLLLLLLAITLLPLGLSFLAQRSLVSYYGNKLAEDTHTLINDNAVNLLHVLVDDYGRILSRDHAMARFALQAQAQAVRQAFVAPQPEVHTPVYLAADFDHPLRQPADLSPSPLHLRRDPDGSLKPMEVSWNHQVFYLAADTDPAEVADQLQRLADMTRIYRSLQQIKPDLFLWQYTALTSGVHSSYPGKGGYPADYDPRRRQWYQQAVINGATVQQVLTDVTTGSLILTLAQPVYGEEGELLGVTALDIDYRKLFTDWNIPPQWQGVTKSMIMRLNINESDPTRQLEILLSNRDNAVARDWSLPLTPEFIDLSDPQLEPVARDLLQGRSGVRKIEYAGEEVLFAYGVSTDASPFPLVMVPYEQVIAPAARARQAVNRQITLGLSFSALLTLVAVLAAVLLALRHARRVTDPITQLATAAQQLTQGKFDARVDIRTNDELQNLGEIFNSLGCRLEEREQLKQSLALAKEIQQQLLPHDTPRCNNFELIGLSRYCDETGGDYYDFISLKEAGNNTLGIVVGDVSGHGIGAALVMASARGMLHALINHHSSDLPGLAAEVNRQLCRSTDDSSFMTLFFGTLDPEQRTLNWVSAGQAPIFLYRAQAPDGHIIELQSSGIPLGILAASDYEMEPAIHFLPGDILLIGTDGIWETHNFAGEIFGTRRLCDILRQSADLPVDKITDRIFIELDQFRGDRTVDDDRTLVLIKATDAMNTNQTI
ncbi:MAG: SpoIIE family protein phosphatase [Pelovirga sp.]